MFAFRESREQDANRIAELEASLAAHVGSLPVRQIEPARVRASRFANRHELHYRTAAFEQLKDEIRRADGNVQPIWVRPLQAGEDPQHDYEIVFGHRRLRACAEIGIPVRAVVADLEGATRGQSEKERDKAIFLAMTMENLAREDLSAYELGQHYDRALKAGLYENQEVLAAALGRTPAHVSQALRVSRLPEDVVAAFSSPLLIQYRWAAEIHSLLSGDEGSGRKALIDRARKARANASLSAREVYEFLVGKDARRRPEIEVELRLGDQTVGNVTLRGGAVAVSIARGALDPGGAQELATLINEFLAQRVTPDEAR